jgi:hypothetical protein
MENLVVHRIVEQHAATRGELIALDHDGASVSYRALNGRANMVARQLLDAGFRRGGHLIVASHPGVDAATMLFAVLKAGGAYTWCVPGEVPWQAAFAPTPHNDLQAYQPIDMGAILQQPLRTSPNLPVLTRPSDIACVLPAADQRQVLVPHSTIVALRGEHPTTLTWDGEPTTFELWAALMSGSRLSVPSTRPLPRAA